MAASKIGLEALAGAALVGGVLFVNLGYKMPGGHSALAREPTGYVPVEVKKADEAQAEAKKTLKLIKRRSSSSEDPAGFIYVPGQNTGTQQFVASKGNYNRGSHEW